MRAHEIGADGRRIEELERRLAEANERVTNFARAMESRINRERALEQALGDLIDAMLSQTPPLSECMALRMTRLRAADVLKRGKL